MLTTNFDVRLTARAVFVPMCVIVVALVITHLFYVAATTVFHLPLPTAIRRALDLNADGGLASLFSAVTMFVASALLALLGAEARRRRGWESKYWFALAGVVVGTAIMHMGFVRMIPNSSVQAHASPLLWRSYLWLIPYAVAAVVFIPFFSSFARRLPIATRRDLRLAIWSYIAASIILEAVERLELPVVGVVHVVVALTLVLTRTIELFAIAYFVAAIMSYVEGRGTPIQLRISVPGVREADREVPVPSWHRADRMRDVVDERTLRH